MKKESQYLNLGLFDFKDDIFYEYKVVWLIYFKKYWDKRVLQLFSLRLNIKVLKYGKFMLFIFGYCKFF